MYFFFVMTAAAVLVTTSPAVANPTAETGPVQRPPLAVFGNEFGDLAWLVQTAEGIRLHENWGGADSGWAGTLDLGSDLMVALANLPPGEPVVFMYRYRYEVLYETSSAEFDPVLKEWYEVRTETVVHTANGEGRLELSLLGGVPLYHDAAPEEPE
jgi:hypothetical protein